MTAAQQAARAAATPRAQVIVIAKQPVSGRVKTRLTPPFSARQAARLAAAALADTLAAAALVPAVRHVLALEGTAGDWLPPGFDVIAQHGRGLDERLAAAFGQAYAQLPVPMVLDRHGHAPSDPQGARGCDPPAGDRCRGCRIRASR